MERALVLDFGGKLWFVAKIRTTQLGEQKLVDILFFKGCLLSFVWI
jgi:hypothetical protein